MQVVEERIGRGRLLHVVYGAARPIPAWVRAANGAFAALMAPAFRTTRVERCELPPSGGRLRVYYGWHAHSWVAHMVIRDLDSDVRPAAIAHNGTSSLLNHRAGAFLGSEMIVFDVNAEATPRRQIAEAMRELGKDVMLFADSGGPYYVLKPGMLKIAREVEAELVPFVIESRPALRWGREMQHLLPVPFARIGLVTGAPLEPGDATLERCTEALRALGAPTRSPSSSGDRPRDTLPSH